MQVGPLATCKKDRKQGVNGSESLGIVLLAQSCLSSFSQIRFYVSEGVIEAQKWLAKDHIKYISGKTRHETKNHWLTALQWPKQNTQAKSFFLEAQLLTMLYFSKSSSAHSLAVEGKQTAPPSIQTQILHMVLEQLSIQPGAEKRLFASLQSSIASQSLCITSSFGVSKRNPTVSTDLPAQGEISSECFLQTFQRYQRWSCRRAIWKVRGHGYIEMLIQLE